MLPATPEDTGDLLRRNFEAREVSSPVWKLFETSGRAAHRRAALSLAPHGATVVLAAGEAVGRAGGDELERVERLERALTILSVPVPHPDLVGEVAAAAKTGQLSLATVEVVSLAELESRLVGGGPDPHSLLAVRIPRP